MNVIGYDARYTDDYMKALASDVVKFTPSSLGLCAYKDGVISSSSAQDSRFGEGAIGICIDVTDLPKSDRSQLSLSFDYTTGDPAEKLFVHLWACVDLDPSQNPEIMNLGSRSGNTWFQVSSDVMDVYNLGRADGAFSGIAGSASDAVVTGLTIRLGRRHIATPLTSRRLQPLRRQSLSMIISCSVLLGRSMAPSRRLPRLPIYVSRLRAARRSTSFPCSWWI